MISDTFKFLWFCVTHAGHELRCTRQRAGLKINPECHCCVSLLLIFLGLFYDIFEASQVWGEKQKRENVCFLRLD